MSNVILYCVAPETAQWLHSAVEAADDVAPERCDDEGALLARLAEGPQPIDALVIGPLVEEPTRVADAVRARDAIVSVIAMGDGPDGARHEARITAVEPTDCARLLDTIRAGVGHAKELRGTTIALRTALEHESARRVRAEVEVETLRDDRRRSAAMHDELLATAAHDIRAPLAVISGAVAELNHPSVGALNDDQAALLVLVRRGVDRLKRLASNLMAIAPLEGGRMEIARRRVDLVELARAAVQSARDEQSVQRVSLHCELPPEPIFVHVDEAKIAILLENMLSHAFRWARREVRLRVVSSGKTARIELEDDGDALADETTSDAFGHTLAGRSRSANGLGPTLVRGIVAAHGGTARAERIVGREGVTGARFIVCLPTHETGDHRAIH